MVKRTISKATDSDTAMLKKLFKEETGLDMDQAVPDKNGKFTSKEEKKKSEKNGGSFELPSKFSEANEEKVSKKDHDKKISELEEKITKFDSKNKELAKERETFRKSSDKFEKLYHNQKSEYDNLCAKYEKQSLDMNKLETDIKNLRKENEPIVIEDGETIAKLRKQLSQKEKEVTATLKKSEELKTEISELNDTIVKLRDKITELERSLPKEKPSVGIVTRVTSTDYRSDLFKEGTYTVNLSTDLSKLVFRFDILGKAKCEKKTISLPAMAKYHPFVREIEYNAIIMNDGAIEINLN